MDTITAVALVLDFGSDINKVLDFWVEALDGIHRDAAVQKRAVMAPLLESGANLRELISCTQGERAMKDPSIGFSALTASTNTSPSGPSGSPSLMSRTSAARSKLGLTWGWIAPFGE